METLQETEKIQLLNNQLEDHSLYSKIQTIDHLKAFMERHVFAVLDFMSLLNSIKKNLLPTETFWSPREDSHIARFINEIVLGEESDITPDGRVLSHFELYIEAMNEVGADTSLISKFVETAKNEGISVAFKKHKIPNSSQQFINETFNLVEENAIHKIVADFCYGREKVIPEMFQAILDKIGVSEENAPSFHYYIQRHIEIDGDEHGPMAEKLLALVCQSDRQKLVEAEKAAISALERRVLFWNQVEAELSAKISTTQL